MSYSLKVDTGDVASKAQKVAGDASTLEQQITTLTSDMQALSETWTGTASGNFQSLYATWKGQAKQIQQQLEQIGQSLKGAGVTYDTAESQNVQALSH